MNDDMGEEHTEFPQYNEQESVRRAASGAESEIRKDMEYPPREAAQAAGDLGLFQELFARGKQNAKDQMYLQWKDLKATAAGALSVIPLVGEAGTFAKVKTAITAGKELKTATKAAKVAQGLGGFDGFIDVAAATTKAKDAKTAFITALKVIRVRPSHSSVAAIKGAIGAQREAGKARTVLEATYNAAGQHFPDAGMINKMDAVVSAQATAKAAAKGAAVRVGLNTTERVLKMGEGAGHTKPESTMGKIFKELDPFPDVPAKVSVTAGIAEFFLPGSNIVPAAWQLIDNKVQSMKKNAEFAGDTRDIILKHLKRSIDNLRKPDVRQAAKSFAPSTV